MGVCLARAGQDQIVEKMEDPERPRHVLRSLSPPHQIYWTEDAMAAAVAGRKSAEAGEHQLEQNEVSRQKKR